MRLSMRNILIAVVIIITLSQLHRIAIVVCRLYELLWNSFEPLRNSPPLAHYTAVLAFGVLVWVTVYNLLIKRRK